MVRPASALYIAILAAPLVLIAAHLPKAITEAERAANPYCDPVKCVMPIERVGE